MNVKSRALNPEEALNAGKALSVCAIYIDEGLIAASSDQLCSAMKARWDKYCSSDIDTPSGATLKTSIMNTIEWSIKMGAMERSIIPGKYSPTDNGWRIGQLWLDKIKACSSDL